MRGGIWMRPAAADTGLSWSVCLSVCEHCLSVCLSVNTVCLSVCEHCLSVCEHCLSFLKDKSELLDVVYGLQAILILLLNVFER